MLDSEGLIMQRIITGKQPNQLPNCYETKKMAINKQTVRAKELNVTCQA